MQVPKSRWGQTVLQQSGQGKDKNGNVHFDKSLSFSIQEAPHLFSLEELRDLFEQVVGELTSKIAPKDMFEIITSLSKIGDAKAIKQKLGGTAQK